MLPLAGVLLLASSMSINHQPIDCFVKDKFVLMEIEVQPAADVRLVRAFFRSARDQEFHYVPLALNQGRFLGKLPKPKDKAGAITYYIEIAGTDGTIRKTPEITGEVAKSDEACPSGSRVAQAAEKGDVRIWTAGTSKSKPRDFDGIDKVIRESDADTVSGAAPAAEGPAAAAAAAPTATATPQIGRG